MRTKTILLSTLLGTLGSISLMAQSTNVYSLNAVGYINVTLYPGYNIVSCPLIASPDNTLNTVMNNGTGTFNGSTVYFWNPATGNYSEDVGSTKHSSFTNGWVNGGTNVLAPGVAMWYQSAAGPGTNVTVTFVGTVPSGTLTNTLVPGYNLVSTILPTSGDIVTNSLMNLTNYNSGDTVYTFDPVAQQYTIYVASAKHGNSGYLGQWVTTGDPQLATVGSGFWYDEATTAINWVEIFSVNQ